MEEQQKAVAADAGAGEIRSKLITRLAVAGVLVALLLGVLAFFDYLATAPDDSEEQVFTKPVPVAPKKEISQPVTPTENLPEPPTPAVPEKTEPPVEPTPAPPVDVSAPPVAEAKTSPISENRPKSLSTAANSKAPSMAAATPAVPAATPVVEPAKAPVPAPSAVHIQPAPRAPVAAESVPAKPSARVLESKPATAVAPPAVSRLFLGFLLQAGVFSSIQRAEELHARLTLSGVPSTLETRVQVGPFKSKQEAEAAQSKLKELGVETILVPPRGKN